MNCRNATRLLSESQERELTLKEKISLRIHIAMCSGCRNAKQQIAVIRAATRVYTGSEKGGQTPPAGERPPENS